MCFSYYGVHFSWQNIVIFMEIHAFDMAIESSMQRQNESIDKQTNPTHNTQKNMKCNK